MAMNHEQRGGTNNSCHIDLPVTPILMRILWGLDRCLQSRGTKHALKSGPGLEFISHET
jgi:hypothetical protein